ncbi:RcnB family protein [Pseudomonas sp. EpS/L25]|uniref:RcnB family protein n=1 Tax=Pseudomonas sp. EpS/L25 TaxID=1749078 RepID=UPI0015A75859
MAPISVHRNDPVPVRRRVVPVIWVQPENVSGHCAARSARAASCRRGCAWSGGRPLPPGYGRPLPPGIVRQLPDYPGYQWRQLGTDVVLIAVGTGLVYAILQGVLD